REGVTATGVSASALGWRRRTRLVADGAVRHHSWRFDGTMSELYRCQAEPERLVMVPKWCHSCAMELTQYVEYLRRELTTAAEVGGEDARALAGRLLPPLDAAVRLTLLEALSAAAEEISAELAPGSVDVRLR